MFGYITINKAEMKFKEFDIYHAYYCGLCRRLKEKYGVLGQLSLSYDMTFLLMLLTGIYEPETKQESCKCIVHPLEKHNTLTNEFTDYLADMNVLFTIIKCKDDWEDERKWWKLFYGKALEGKSGKAGRCYEKKVHRIAALMQEFTKAEQTGEKDIDKIAGLFGNVMAQITMYRQDEWSESLQRLGFYLGKFIYILDAYEDVEKDIRKGCYNPLKDKYSLPDFDDECRTILTLMISECCKEFEKLPILEYADILRNILYSGVWNRYEITRRKREKQEEERADGRKV